LQQSLPAPMSHTNSNRHILVTGYYYKQNTGDELLLRYAQSIFQTKPILLNKDSREISVVSTKYISTDCIPFDKPEVIADIIKWTDCVVLFGGEVLNTYFLNRLIRLKQTALNDYRKHITFYAFGVSCNSDYTEITSQMDLFEYVIFRNRKDYQYFLPRFTSERSCVLPDPVFAFSRESLLESSRLKRKLNKVSTYIKTKVPCIASRPAFHVAFFLSQTSRQQDFDNAIVKLIRKCVRYHGRVSLFTMCNGKSDTENDMVMNSRIYSQLSDADKSVVIVYDKPSDIFRHIESIDAAVCWRFHAHVFCIQYAIPFISLSVTPKVSTLLSDNHLTHLSYADKLIDLEDGLDYLLRDSNIIHTQLRSVWKQLHPLAKSYSERWGEIISTQRHLPRVPINDTVKTTLITNISELYTMYSRKDDNAFNATLLLYLITGKMKTQYHWGLCEKIASGATIQTLAGDIDWLIQEQIKIGNYAFYWKVISYLGMDYELSTPMTRSRCIHIHYMDQNDMKGVHRAGWEYVIDHIEKEMATFHPLAMRCDLYLDRTFHWNYDVNRAIGVIPYRRPWIGFIHHTSNTEYTQFNVVELFKKEAFIESLHQCKGLIVLTNYLKKQVKQQLIQANSASIPVFVLFHPTEFIEDDRCFDMVAFEKQETRRIVQVGAWYRDIGAIFQLKLGDNPLKYDRCALKGPQMDGYYKFLEGSSASASADSNGNMQISRDNSSPSQPNIIIDNTQKPVVLLSELSPADYDNMFRLCIIFIRLIDGSAANTIIESIVRNTPILINRIEPVVEYLGEDYPFYYTTLEEATQKANNIATIRKTYEYLRNKDKSFLRVEQFIRSFQSLPIFS
jgi:polysaccharide pyruvyl transferase WcaK-like protein